MLVTWFDRHLRASFHFQELVNPAVSLVAVGPPSYEAYALVHFDGPLVEGRNRQTEDLWGKGPPRELKPGYQETMAQALAG
jgi:hypothetical protein